MKTIRSLFILTTLILISSCSKIKKAETNMDEMNVQTTQMNNKMDVTNANMDTTNSKMQDMKDVTSDMYYQKRPKDAEDARRKQFLDLMNPSIRMGLKLKAASAWHQAFEYQLWTSNGPDLNQRRNELLKLAMEEFFKSITQFSEVLSDDMSPTNTDPSKYNNDMAYYALSVTMHEVNPFQEKLAHEKKEISKLSVYDIINNALIKENAGLETTDYENIVLIDSNKNEALSLLKARFEMVTALGIKDVISTTNEMKTGDLLKAGLFKFIGLGGSLNFSSTFHEKNIQTKKDSLMKLEEALNIKNRLEVLDQNIILEKNLRSIVQNLNFSKGNLSLNPNETYFDRLDNNATKTQSSILNIEFYNIIEELGF